MFVGPLETSDLVVIPCRRIADHRGHFCETYSKRLAERFGVVCEFVQDNEALSKKTGTLRGLHFQVAPSAQAKLIRVIRGAIFDVVVDLRAASLTRGQWRGVRLEATSDELLFVPAGFAHAYVTLEPDTLITYKVDCPYDAAAEAGIRWDDPDIGIDWPMKPAELTISERDAKLPRLRDVDVPFRF